MTLSEDEPAPTGKTGLPATRSDLSEQELRDKLDNIVPTHGYRMIPMVGLGGSAGSISALQTFFGAMPPMSGMAFVVILHLAPEHESALPQLLARSTKMRVRSAADGDGAIGIKRIKERAIQVARAGVYPETIAADVSEERLRRFFIKEPRGYHVRREVREIVLFAAHDLLKDAPFSRMDLISCRNLLIYLNRDAQKRALDIFHFAMNPHGLLFLGSSESVEDDSPLFSVLDKKHRIFTHRPAQRVSLPVPQGPSTLIRALELQERERTVLPAQAFMQRESARHGELVARREAQLSVGELHFRLVERFAPPSVVVDAEHEIVHISENAGSFLRRAGGEPSMNRVVHPMLRAQAAGGAVPGGGDRPPAGDPAGAAGGRRDAPGGEPARRPGERAGAGLPARDLRAHRGRAAHRARPARRAGAAGDPAPARARAGGHPRAAARHGRAVRGEHRGAQGRQRGAAGDERGAALRFRGAGDQPRGAAVDKRRADHGEPGAQEQARRAQPRQLRSVQPDGLDGHRHHLSRPRAAHHALHALRGAAVPAHRGRHRPAARRPPAPAGVPAAHRRCRAGAGAARAGGARGGCRRRALVPGAASALPHPGRSARRRGADLRRCHREQALARGGARQRSADAADPRERQGLRDLHPRPRSPGQQLELRRSGAARLHRGGDLRSARRHPVYARALARAQGRLALLRLGPDQAAARQPRSWLFSASPLATFFDGQRYVVGAALDVTDSRRSRAELEAALAETQQARQQAETVSRTKDHFLATLSHELRTPLTPVLAAAESMLRRCDLPPIVREGLAMICRNVELENRLINDLLDITRISRGKLELAREPMDLHQAVSAAIDISRSDISAKRQHLTVELNAEQRTLNADVMRIQQVFWNLRKNAAKFTPVGGSITVRSRSAPGSVLVEVADTGLGIEPSALPNIFVAFQQADASITCRFGGLGLGLAIAAAPVEAHGGTIEAASAGAGQGSTFTVKLPLHMPEVKHE